MATIDEIVFLIKGDTKNLDNALRASGVKIDQASTKMVKDLNRVDKSVASLGSSFKLLGGAIGAIGVVKFSADTLKAASDIEQLNARMLVTVGNAKDAAEAMNFLRKTAKEQSVDLLVLADGYNRLLPSVKSSALSMDEMRTILKLTNDNIRALGISTADTQRIFFGLSQLFGSGIVTMENLKQVTEVLPGSLSAVAKQMGVLKKTTDGTLGALVKLVSTGKLASTDLKDSLIAAFRANEGAAIKMADTMAATKIRFSNALREIQADLLLSTGALDGMAKSLNFVTENLGSIATVIEAITFVFGVKLVSALTLSTAAIIRNEKAMIRSQAASIQIQKQAQGQAQAARVQAAQAQAQALAAQALAAETAKRTSMAQLGLATAITKTSTANLANAASTTKASIAQLGLATSATKASTATLALSVASIKATFAVRTLTATLAFFGGPIGLAITVVGAALIILSNNEKTADKAAKIHIETLAKARDIYIELKNAAKDRRIELAKESEALTKNTKLEIVNLKAKIAVIKTNLSQLGQLAKQSIRIADLDAENSQSTLLVTATQELRRKKTLELLGALKKLDDELTLQLKQLSEVEGILKDGVIPQREKDANAIKKQSASVNKLIEDLQFEIRIARLGDRERTIEIATRKAIRAIMKDTGKTQAQVTEQYKKEIKEVTKLSGSLFDLAKAEKDVQEETKDLTKELTEISTESQRAAENIQDSLADAIGDVITNLDDLEGVGKRVFNNILKFAIDAFSQIAAQQILGGIAGGGGGGIAGVLGGAAAGGAGGLGGIGSLFGAGKSLLSGGSLLFNQGAAAATEGIGQFFGLSSASSVGALGPLPVGGSSLGQVAGQAFSPASVAGGFIGNLGANALLGGDRGVGASVGGAVGAVAGQIAIPIPVVGAAIGSFLGNALGGLIGGGKPGIKISEFAAEQIGGETGFGSKRQSTEFAESLSAQLNNFIDAIELAGDLQVRGGVRGGVSTRRPGAGGFLKTGFSEALTEGQKLFSFDPESAEEVQEAFNNITEEFLKTADIANTEVAEALRNLQLDGLSAAEAIRAVSIASGQLADQFNQQLEQEILKLTDARAFEIQLIEMQTEALKQEAIAIGGNVKLVEELGQLRLDQLDVGEEQTLQLREQESLQKDITSALQASGKEAQRLSEQFAKIAADLKQTALDLQLGDLSALAPEQQLDISRQAFTDLSRRAALGDVAAAQELPNAATAFLEESRNFNASNAAFKSDFASVQTGLLGAGDVFTRQSANQAGVVNAINNSISASNSGLNAIVTQLINLTQQNSVQTQTLKDLTIMMSA